MDRGKKTVLATLMLAVLFLIGGGVYKATRPLEPIVFNISNQPTIGTGSVELVLFEDFCCTNCRAFTEAIFPQITSQYIDTGKAKLSVIIVAFTEYSKTLANAALTVYKIAPEKFIAYILEFSHSTEVGKNELLRAAEAVGGIDLEKLSQGIDERPYFAHIDQNLFWAKNLIGDDFGTPSLFVNGIEVSTDSFTEIVHYIEKMGKQQ